LRAIAGLGVEATSRALPALDRLTSDDDHEVRREAENLLARLRAPPSAPSSRSARTPASARSVTRGDQGQDRDRDRDHLRAAQGQGQGHSLGNGASRQWPQSREGGASLSLASPQANSRPGLQSREDANRSSFGQPPKSRGQSQQQRVQRCQSQQPAASTLQQRYFSPPTSRERRPPTSSNLLA